MATEQKKYSGAAFEPDEEAKFTLKEGIVEVLRERGSQGMTRWEAPEHMILSMPARISELRKDGYDIISLRDGEGNLVRYVLIGEPPSKAA